MRSTRSSTPSSTPTFDELSEDCCIRTASSRTTTTDPTLVTIASVVRFATIIDQMLLRDWLVSKKKQISIVSFVLLTQTFVHTSTSIPLLIESCCISSQVSHSLTGDEPFRTERRKIGPSDSWTDCFFLCSFSNVLFPMFFLSNSRQTLAKLAHRGRCESIRSLVVGWTGEKFTQTIIYPAFPKLCKCQRSRWQRESVVWSLNYCSLLGSRGRWV